MEQTNQYLTFTMRAEKYALAVDHIREVLVVPQVTRIPRMPDYMSGVINLRGSVVPVLDLGQKFGMEKTAFTQDTSIIVVEIPADNETGGNAVLYLGLLADSVEKVLSIEPGQIEPPPRIGTRVNTTFIKGMGHVDEKFIVILDIREILTADDLDVMEDAQDLTAAPTQP